MSTVDKFEDILQNFYKFLNIFGIYRPKSARVCHRIFSILFQFVFLDMFEILMILFYFHTKSLNEAVHLSVFQLIVLSVTLKCKIVTNQFHKVEDILKELKDLLKICSEKRIDFGDFLLTRLQQAQKVLLVFWLTTMTAVVLQVSVYLVNEREPPYMLPYMIHPFPYLNYEENYGYFLVTTFYVYVGACATATYEITVLSVTLLLFSSGIGLLEELSARMASMEIEPDAKFAIGDKVRNFKIGREDEEKILSDLRRCIEIHKRIKDFLKKSQKILSPTIFIQVIFSSLVFCMLSYMVSMVRFFQFLTSIKNKQLS